MKRKEKNVDNKYLLFAELVFLGFLISKYLLIVRRRMACDFSKTVKGRAFIREQAESMLVSAAIFCIFAITAFQGCVIEYLCAAVLCVILSIFHLWETSKNDI